LQNTFDGQRVSVLVASLRLVEPGVFQEFICREPLLRVKLQEASDYISCPLRNAVPIPRRKIKFSLLDLLDYRASAIIPEWRIPTEHYIEDYTNAPGVAFVAILLVSEDFWGEVAYRPTGGFSEGVG